MASASDRFLINASRSQTQNYGKFHPPAHSYSYGQSGHSSRHHETSDDAVDVLLYQPLDNRQSSMAHNLYADYLRIVLGFGNPSDHGVGLYVLVFLAH